MMVSSISNDMVMIKGVSHVSPFFSDLKNATVNAIATIIAMKSAIGAAYKIPSMPNFFGRIRISGIKQTISRTIEEITACTGFPAA